MNPLRDAVEHVQECAERGMLPALDAVLRNPDAQRGVRLAAANYLARAGEPGLALLRAILTDHHLDALALNAAFLSLKALGHMPNKERPVRRQNKTWVSRLDKPELRDLFPEPYRSTPDLDHHLPQWLTHLEGDDWRRVVWAVCLVKEDLPASTAHALASQLQHRRGEDLDFLTQAVAQIGGPIVPFLVGQLTYDNPAQMVVLARTLELIGDPAAIEPLQASLNRMYRMPNPSRMREAIVCIRLTIGILRRKQQEARAEVPHA